ncbi:MAG: hypothetical protein QXW47_11170 [Candidatus Jordarchaeales archaeon]|nr:hypothetical protein [Candidatus Jordarchaeia archaeon]
MRILVNGVDITETEHYGKRVLLDTMILCYASDELSPSNRGAAVIIKAAVLGFLEAYVSLQNIAELYSVITSRKVQNPLSPSRAAEICTAYLKSTAIRKLQPTIEDYREAVLEAERIGLRGGDFFDALLACTARGKVEFIWTENIKDFKQFKFVETENPLEWLWETTNDEIKD